jgi:repressor LexA
VSRQGPEGRREKELFRFLETFFRRQSHFPSYREIAAGLGWKSTSTVARYVRRLVAAGLLEKEPGRVRSFRLKRYRRGRYLRGQVEEVEIRRAGAGGEAPPRTVWLDRGWFEGRDLGLWELEGEGPYSWGLEEGDRIVVDTAAELNAGDLALVFTGDELLAGRVYLDGSRVSLLIAEEPEEVFFLGDNSQAAKLLGRVVGIVRRC